MVDNTRKKAEGPMLKGTESTSVVWASRALVDVLSTAGTWSLGRKGGMQEDRVFAGMRGYTG
jgi:hypothetical protein